ncbi:ATP-binding cassette domain-containing protein [Rhizohabitans arisaemae]|uniref:ATP-binding cassette domain-containing protein n=1 Tax=Rhizohabitans arisaemae TaxID=2720610 RepID=UPI0024B0DBCA|nr:ABC transporter ATP-binding protein [Rhizohabitans arisaemae]
MTKYDRTVSRAGWRLLTRELARRRRPLMFLGAWSVVESLPALISGFAVAAALDQGFLSGRPLVGLAWLGVLGLAAVVQGTATRNAFPWLAAIVEPVRDAMVRIVVSAALRRAVEGNERQDGAVVARLSGQTEAVRNLVAALLRTLRPAIASLVLALAGLAALAPVVALITIPLVSLCLVLFAWLTRALAVRQREMVLAEETMASVATDTFEGLRDVVAAGAVDSAGAVVDQAATAQARAGLALARTLSIRTVIVALGDTMPVLLVLASAPWLLRSGRMTPGELVGATTYLVGTLSPALHSLTGTVASWARQLGVLLHRIAETSTVPPTPEHVGRGTPESGDIHVTGLTFAYGPHAAPVIDNLDLRVPDGEHLAVVGPSGIGKSTLAALLTGLAVPQAGTVRLGGTPLAEIDASHLRGIMALLPQEAYVFTGSLRENIAYLRPSASTVELDLAVDALGIRPLVDRLGGYGAPLGVGGATLSAGERQLIALARVYVSTARVVVLDEATCLLDPVAEARAEEAFAAGGRTLIVIAHRVSSARRARRILLLDGTTAMSGTHGELVATAPRYADLVGDWSVPTHSDHA